MRPIRVNPPSAIQSSASPWSLWRDRGLILLLGAILFLPNLGSFALWEEDEAHNAGCTKEMLAADTWIVPTFNYVLRPDKPVLLYWCQRLTYALVGVNEWGARLPSALASLLSLLLVYETGRSWRDPETGRWAALLLGTMLMFGVLAKAATPDGLFIAAVLGCLWVRVRAEQDGSGSASGRWLLAYGFWSGLAVLAKGPIGLLLPSGIIGLHLIWQRQLYRLWTPYLIGGLTIFALITLPWFLAVGVATRFAFWRGFFGQHNVGRFLHAMEGHGGGWWLQPLLLLLTTAPWSVFIGWLWWSPSPAQTWRDRLSRWRRPADGEEAVTRLLLLWVVVWVVFFSLSATKLPNYLAPAFAPLALLLASALVRWRQGQLTVPAWAVQVSLGLVVLIGIGLSTATVLVSGLVPLPLLKGRFAPGLAPWVWLGGVLAAGGMLSWLAWRRGERTAALRWLGGGVAFFSALLAASLPLALDRSRAPKALAEALRRHQVDREVLLGCHDRYLPSLVFYTGHALRRSLSDADGIILLTAPVQSFLVVGERDWPRLAARLGPGVSIVARHFDIKAGQHLLLVTNKTPAASTAPAVGALGNSTNSPLLQAIP